MLTVKKIGIFDLDENSNFVGWIFMVIVARALSPSNMSIALFAAAPASHGLELRSFRFPSKKSNGFPLALWNSGGMFLETEGLAGNENIPHR